MKEIITLIYPSECIYYRRRCRYISQTQVYITDAGKAGTTHRL